MRPISLHELNGHRQKLRQIFAHSAFEAGAGVTFELHEGLVPSAEGPVLSLVLAPNVSTEIAMDERNGTSLQGLERTYGAEAYPVLFL